MSLQKIAPTPFLSKSVQYFFPWNTVAQKYGQLLSFSRSCTKKTSPNRRKFAQIGETSPNLVTLVVPKNVHHFRKAAVAQLGRRVMKK
jgi:hypothetical protein